MDSIDIKILKILQENARTSNSEISNRINLSLSATGERIKKLENSGVIKHYTTIINNSSLQIDLMAIMDVRLGKPQFTEKFMAFIEKEDEILECLHTAGGYDYIIKIATKNTFTLEQLLTRIKSVDGVLKTNTNVVLSTPKYNYSIIPSNDK